MTHSARQIFGLAIISMLFLAAAHTAAADASRDNHSDKNWAATWATASKAKTIFDRALPALSDVTVRQIVRVSVGGTRVRVWLTNEAGTAPLHVGAASVALRGEGSDLARGSRRDLRFGGASEIVIAPGARVVSDPVRLRTADLADLVVSVYLPDDVTASGSPVTYHVRSLQTSYLAAGNQASADFLANVQTEASWFFLAGVDVDTGERVPVIAALGDSITDGDQLPFPNEPVDLNARYTNVLAQRLLARHGTGERQGAAEQHPVAVVNLGISGNQVTATFLGANAQARFDRDVLSQTGVTHLIVVEGINDIGLPGLLTAIGLPTPAISAATIIAGLQQIAARAHAHGLIVLGGTLSPSGSSPLPGYSGAAVEAKRQAVNAWIRSGGAFDRVVDFDALLRDPANPAVMRADLTAEGLHPNSEGYRRMADAVIQVLAADAR